VMEDLQVSELMYRPVGGSNFEFIELHNGNAGAALDIDGVKFTQGIDFTFAQGTSIPAGGYLVLVKATNANNFALFRQYYGLTNDELIVGSYSGSLDNNGETVTLKTAAGGATIVSFK